MARKQKDLEAAILQAVDDGFVTFISGMARGVDIWAAEIVLRIPESILQSTLWQHHPTVGLKADGLRIGKGGTMPYSRKSIW